MSDHRRLPTPILLKEAEEIPEKRPFPVTAITVLLLIQAAGFIFISLRAFLAHPFESGESPNELLDFLIILWQTSLTFTILAVIGLFAAIAFFRLWQQAWGIGMLVQGSTLFTALLAYVRETTAPLTIYLLMIFAIFMVSYLNHPEVLATFGINLSLRK